MNVRISSSFASEKHCHHAGIACHKQKKLHLFFSWYFCNLVARRSGSFTTLTCKWIDSFEVHLKTAIFHSFVSHKLHSDLISGRHHLQLVVPTAQCFHEILRFGVRPVVNGQVILRATFSRNASFELKTETTKSFESLAKQEWVCEV